MYQLPEELSGLELQKVQKLMKSLDYQLILRETRPPEAQKGSGKERVIAARFLDNNRLEIIWSYEKYL